MLARTKVRVSAVGVSLLHQLPSPVMAVDRYGLIVSMNRIAEDFLGCKDVHAAGRPWSALIETNPDIAAAVFAALEAGAPFLTDPITIHISERDEPKTAILELIGNADDEMPRILILRDLTNFVQSEYRFQQTRGAEWLRYLCDGLANEFNNVVMNLQASAEEIHSRTQNGSPVVDSVRNLRETVQRAAVVTRRLHALGGTVATDARPLDLNSVVKSMLPTLKGILGEELDCSLCPDRLLIEADRAQVQEVIANLARHASQHTNGGRIVLRTKCDTVSERRAIEHIDMMPGQHAVLELCFPSCGGRRQRLDLLGLHSLTDEKSAMTLDIPSALGLIKQAGGTIILGRDSSDSITTCAYWPAAGRIEPMRPEQIAKGHGQGVLLVEHEPDSRSWSAEVLLNYGYHVLTAGDGPEALHVARQQKEPVQILLTDLYMPSMGGIELANRMRKMWPQTEAIYLSSYSPAALISHGLPQELVIVKKPVVPETLARMVHSILNKSAIH